MTSNFIHPALIMILGAVILPYVRGPLRKPYLMLVPVLAFIDVVLLGFNHGVYGVFQYMDWTLVFGRVDRLSSVFGFVMSLMAVIGTLYGLGVDDEWEHMAAWFYVAGSLGTIYCGDYLTLFFFWEMMAFASVFLIWFRRRPQSRAAGYRYLLVHTLGGLLLLIGIMLHYRATGSLAFEQLDVSNPGIATWMIMLGFALNAAVVPLHSWLPDAYSEASFNGAVFMCAFTTKTAVYTLARSCAGFDILILLGVIMAVYGVVYAVMENDIRRLIAWSIVSQVGYMVTGVGIGSELAINGACAHAFAHILYKGLLFMGTGSVLYMTGKTKFTELGGLYRKMPATTIYTIVGCLSIAAAPFFSGFVTKSMIISAGFEEHLNWASFLLMMAATGTFVYNGLKLPWFLFFGERHCDEATWERAGDPPWNMQMAMFFGAFFCIFIGSFTPFLYNMLPYPVHYHPYSLYHVAETLQIFAFAGFAFIKLRKYLEPRPCTCLDMDWFYRRFGQGFIWVVKHPLAWFDTAWGEAYRVVGLGCLMTLARFWSWFDWHGIDGVVDGTARTVRGIGARLRRMQPSQIQVSIYITALCAAVILLSYVAAQV